MSVFKEEFVIINIWTNKSNKALSTANEVGHISITTPNRYISLWPNRNFPIKEATNIFFAPLSVYQSSYKSNYEQDCILEGNCRPVNPRIVLDVGERPYRLNKETGEWEEVDSVPYASKDEYMAFKPLEAPFRMVLYSLDILRIEEKFDQLKHSIKGWRLIGTNSLTRYIKEKTTESCASLAYQCLQEGGLYDNLKFCLSSQVSSIVDPEDLLRHVVAAKEKELAAYPQTANWRIEGILETKLEDIKEGYRRFGLNANVEEDGVINPTPASLGCVIL